MFDFGTWGEILIIVVAALIFIGPKELPTLLRGLGRMIQKFKRMSSGLRQEMNKYINEGEFEEYKKDINTLGMMESDEDDIEDLDGDVYQEQNLSYKKKRQASKKKKSKRRQKK